MRGRCCSPSERWNATKLQLWVAACIYWGWPTDRAAFAEYWDTGLAKADIDPTIRTYFDALIDLRTMPLPVR
ncbi:hypothetical protein OIE68_09355 [Nocardia vinacea]|uniref:oxygenase MpaB family protein n=1 Tax=Nocardia vinacea TaxID=96468 RepID=UPI002E13B99D|nr:hypothetical protein OIE68_09355 [Nocardia vinacea]